MMSKIRRIAIALLIVSGVIACSWLPEVKEETTGWSAEKLYSEAHGALVSGNYTRAVKLFDTLEGRFPYGRYAQQAILEGAYANFRQGETTPAIAACDRFIRTYPNHQIVDYAYYLKGLINFREDQGIFGYIAEQDLSERDPKMTKEAFAAFREIATRFPDSRYAADSIERMRYLTNALAGYEVHGRLEAHALRDRLHAQMKELMDSGIRPLIVDARSESARNRDPSRIPTAVILEGFDSLRSGREIIVYCT